MRNINIDKLLSAQKKINEAFGEGAILYAHDQSIKKYDVISTGSIGLDMALGVSGLPRGRIIEIFGKESSGKTTIALHVIAESQKLGGSAVFIDVEHALDMSYACNLGVRPQQLLITQPDYGEQAMDILYSLLSMNAVDVIVLDSVAALASSVEMESSANEQQIAPQARLMSRMLRKIVGLVSRSRAVVIFINQTRAKLNLMTPYANETTTGRSALKFYSSIRLNIQSKGFIQSNKQIVGHKTHVKVVKNKCALPYRIAEIDILYGKGIMRAWEIIGLGVRYQIIDKRGNWYYFGKDKIGMGHTQVSIYLEKNPSVVSLIEKEIHKIGYRAK